MDHAKIFILRHLLTNAEYNRYQSFKPAAFCASASNISARETRRFARLIRKSSAASLASRPAGILRRDVVVRRFSVLAFQLARQS
ncbi:MAG: hypothetical protein DME88_09470 [Verrucomicrobia bacterium]|nr:MAG: hypothetical protein DME88_09470 [Verrucomicrobiota bacterium]